MNYREIAQKLYLKYRTKNNKYKFDMAFRELYQMDLEFEQLTSIRTQLGLFVEGKIKPIGV